MDDRSLQLKTISKVMLLCVLSAKDLKVRFGTIKNPSTQCHRSEHSKVLSGPCPFNAPILHPCSGNQLTGQYISVYHTNQPSLPHKTSCICTISSNKEISVHITVTAVPGFANCGTPVDIIYKDKTVTSVQCKNALIRVFLETLKVHEEITMRFYTYANSSVVRSYCLYVEGSNGNININCTNRIITSTTTQISRMTSLQTIQQTSHKSDNNASYSTFVTTERIDNISEWSTQFFGTADNLSNNTSSRFELQTKSTYLHSSSIPNLDKGHMSMNLLVLISAVSGGALVVCLVIVIVTVVICMRKRRSTRSSKTSSLPDNKMQSYEDKVLFDADEMKDNILYESSNDIEVPQVVNVSFQNESSGYADVTLPPLRNVITDNGLQDKTVPIYSKPNNIPISRGLPKSSDNGGSDIEEQNDAPIYSVPDKRRHNDVIKSDNAKNVDAVTSDDEGPVYALPLKKNTKSNDNNEHKQNYSKPQVLPKPVTNLRSHLITTTQENGDITNSTKPTILPKPTNPQLEKDQDNPSGRKLVYSELHFDESSPNASSYIDVDKTTYAEVCKNSA